MAYGLMVQETSGLKRDSGTKSAEVTAEVYGVGEISKWSMKSKKSMP